MSDGISDMMMERTTDIYDLYRKYKEYQLFFPSGETFEDWLITNGYVQE